MATGHGIYTRDDSPEASDVGAVQHNHLATPKRVPHRPSAANKHASPGDKHLPVGSRVGKPNSPTSTSTKCSGSAETATTDDFRRAAHHASHTPQRRTPKGATRSRVSSQPYAIPPSPIDEQSPMTTGANTTVPVDTEAVRIAMNALRATEQVELLDAMDDLRKENISTFLNIPQIVVCGDQSSGKSAVLEAISRLPFRSGSKTATCFPTELILRNAPTTSLRVSIAPHSYRLNPKASSLPTFEMTAQSIDEFQSIHDVAAEFLNSHAKSGPIMFDSLRIEVTGPEQPHLTLVDLPGLTNSTPKGMSRHTPRRIKNLMSSYLNQPRTIILAVVNAAYDSALSSVLGMISDEIRPRTMGIVTHPDAIDTIDSTNDWKEILNHNRRYTLGLGWHALCNLNHESKDRTAEKRDQQEAVFFRTGSWASVDPQLCGVDTLRQKLSKHLLTLTRDEMPALLTAIAQHIEDRKQILEQYGPE
ncbi:hypothetical protein AMS68_001667 [Peltaster fructicola]|uniref:Dynamin-type G domain-containing protein n=1 Tax=Peltaster fructicola TaxID=286661 RepID=A0A6H0XNT8_9PEZI|nr:hypothetical protein AMS68_001667 [Peltaster fructicola]